MNSRPLACRVSTATGMPAASGHDFTQRCLGDQLQRSRSQAGHQTDGPMSVSLLFLPLQAVRANLRLATQAVQPYMDASGDRQSLICANLLALSFHSVFPCLRGESSSAPLRVLFAAHVPTSARLISGACHVQAVGNQQAQISLRGGNRNGTTPRKEI